MRRQLFRSNLAGRESKESPSYLEAMPQQFPGDGA